jgi:hypothetical protein
VRPPLRAQLLDKVVERVNRLQAGSFDYATMRYRLILEALTQGVQYVYNNAVEGDVAEFGTASGFSSLILSRAMAAYHELLSVHLSRHNMANGKTLHLFDSFRGLPKPDHSVDAASPYVQAGRWQEGTFTGLTEDEVGALCASAYDRNRILVYAGWFKDSLATLAPETRFAMVHLDCDLYSSTLEVLEFLLRHGHLAEGAVLFFDDWNCNRSSPQFGQRRAWREVVQSHRVNFSDGGDYAILGHKFTIHGAG